MRDLYFNKINTLRQRLPLHFVLRKSVTCIAKRVAGLIVIALTIMIALIERSINYFGTK
ncbi:hypothetical protein TUM4644_29780 [Shewanella colwelliana]|uniref:hypothetical protein n=1 Tax=Shewanella colwelliana TaxID=23 RepID=UPI001BB88F2C|nr:hypothetical protein [Shewanella colwelliana]GIU30637.1 hypothetical protein TUM4644_29780 [Shewanella colwelliana]